MVMTAEPEPGAGRSRGAPRVPRKQRNQRHVQRLVAPAAVLSAAAQVIGFVLPLVSVGASHRSLVGLTRSAWRLGQLNGLRVLIGVVILASPVLAVVGAARVVQQRSWARLLCSASATIGVVAGSVLGLTAGVSAVMVIVMCSSAGLLLVAHASNTSPVQRQWRNAFVPVLVACASAGIAVAALRISTPPGARTAPDAANSVTQAIAQGDLLTFAEYLDPTERDALFASGRSLVAELRRLDVANTSPGDGASRSNLAAPGLTVTSPEAGFAIATLDGQLVLPSSAKRLLRSQPAKRLAQFDRLVLVSKRNRWFVSVVASAAESQRVKSGHIGAVAVDVTPKGAANPEAAVRTLLRAIADVDSKAIIAIMDPEEGAVLYRYGDMYTDEIQRWSTWSDANATLSFPDVGLISEQSGDTATVRMNRLSAELVLPSDLGIGTRVVLDGNCIEATVEQDSSRHCGQAIPKVIADLFGVKAPDLGKLEWLDKPEQQLSFSIVQRNGVWFVAPLRTILDTFTLRLSTMTRSDFRGPGNSPAERLDRWVSDPLRAFAT
jgi:hypothetical protein